MADINALADPEGLQAQFGIRPNPGPYANALAAAIQRYPVLQPYRNMLTTRAGTANDDRQLEFYPPWESENPSPGHITLEMYPRGPQSGPALERAIANDSLHYLGAIDPRSGQPVDPHYYGLKQQFIQSLTPQQLAVDQRAYQQERQQGEDRSFDDWMQQSRADAYLRAFMSPEDNPEWRHTFVPEQQPLLSTIRSYLTTGRR